MKFGDVLAVFFIQIRLSLSLKILELTVPTHKLVGEGVRLVCKFDMEGEMLYSVKWYRNEQEFYRFVPNDRPKLQIFPQDGIKVERSKSSRQHVFLTDLQLDASGTYRCEVSGEAPSFRTKHQEKVMVVVQEPYHNEIINLKPRYYTGDLVNVTCYSRGSSPPASLHWKINGEAVLDNINYMNGNIPTKRNRYARYSGNLQDTEYQIFEPEIVQPRGEYGRIHDWFEKHDKYPHLDTAASNLQFIVRDQHRHTGLQLECTASIGAVYWHATQETCQVSAKPRELTGWMSSGSGHHLPGKFCLILLAWCILHMFLQQLNVTIYEISLLQVTN